MGGEGLSGTSTSLARQVSIVIPAFNDQELIRRSLQAAVDQTVSPLC